MVFVENDSFRNLRRLPADAFRSIPRLPREVLPVAASDLVAWYPFRAGTGVDATAGDTNFGDSTDYSATVNGASFKPDSGVHDIQNGANSGAFDFDGTDDLLAVDNPKTITDLSEITVSAFVRIDTPPSTVNTVFSVSNSAGRDDDFLLNASNSALSGDALQFLTRDGGATVTDYRLPNAVTDGDFHHIGVTVDSGGTDIYLDGNNVTANGTFSAGSASSTRSPVDVSNADSVTLGANKSQQVIQFFYDGTLDGLRIYQAALSDSQIYQIYKNTRPVTRLDSLAARYTFNDGAAQDQTAGVPVSGDSTDYSGTLNGTTPIDDGGVNDG